MNRPQFSFLGTNAYSSLCANYVIYLWYAVLNIYRTYMSTYGLRYIIHCVFWKHPVLRFVKFTSINKIDLVHFRPVPQIFFYPPPPLSFTWGRHQIYQSTFLKLQLTLIFLSHSTSKLCTFFHVYCFINIDNIHINIRHKCKTMRLDKRRQTSKEVHAYV